MPLALEGIKVIDMSRTGPAAHCSMVLGDLGAEVLKVEEPVKPGGPFLGSGRSPIGAEGRREAAYRALNRNKRSLGLNLKTEAGRQIFFKLVQSYDAVVEGFSPGTLMRLGIDYETVSQLNAGIIYCSISAYGQDGPYRDLPGHDPTVTAFAGVLGLTGDRGSQPVHPLNLVGDWAGGSLQAVIGVLAALQARDRTGRGQRVDISMTDGALSLLFTIFGDYFRTGIAPRRGELQVSGAFPGHALFQTKDSKYISLGCVEPRFWANLCRALGREDFIPYQWDEQERREEIFAYFRQAFLTKTRDEWFDYLRQIPVTVGKVYSLDEVPSDPQVAHRRMIRELDHPTEGKVKQVGIPIKLSDTPGEIRSFSPLLGEDTKQVLSELGYGYKQIAKLRKTGVVSPG